MSKSKSFRTIFRERSRSYQETFRNKMKEQGYKQVNLWMDKETLKLVGDRTGKELQEFIKDALKSYASNKITDKVPNNVDKNLTNNSDSEVTSKAGNRYMSADIEKKIIELRANGLSLQQISNALADEGVVSATGKPYSTGTLSKVITRIRSRQG